jgi:hypothetical protein
MQHPDAGTGARIPVRPRLDIVPSARFLTRMKNQAPVVCAHAAPLRCALAIGVWAVILFAAAMAMLLAAELLADSPLLGLGFMLPGLIMALIGALGIWAMVDTLRLPGPVLTIGPAGVRDRRITDATLPWSEIEWQRVVVSTKRANGEAVQFHLHGAYPISLPHRAMAVANRLMGHPPLTIVAMGIDRSTPDIAAAFARFKPALA